MRHYLEQNPILGSYQRKIASFVSLEEKQVFYKEAKDFFFQSVQIPVEVSNNSEKPIKKVKQEPSSVKIGQPQHPLKQEHQSMKIKQAPAEDKVPRFQPPQMM
jgi:hypothetical protein